MTAQVFDYAAIRSRLRRDLPDVDPDLQPPAVTRPALTFCDVCGKSGEDIADCGECSYAS
jgi:hypothetical protein